MKITTRSLLILVVSGATILHACRKDLRNTLASAANKPHAVRIFLTDHPTPVFDSVFIDIQMLEVKVEDDSLGHGGWVALAIHPGVYNILRFRNGLDTLFASGVLPNARISKLRLTLGTNNSVMKNGQTFPLSVHDEDRVVVANLDATNFEVIPPDQVLFWIDFDAAGSIQEDNSGPGHGNGFRLKSHITVFARNNTGRIEGHVLPKAADPVVMAINGTDTTMAIPDDDNGEFKIVGLRPNTYRLFVDGNNGFNDTTINNIIVRSGEDTHVPTITLHH